MLLLLFFLITFFLNNKNLIVKCNNTFKTYFCLKQKHKKLVFRPQGSFAAVYFHEPLCMLLTQHQWTENYLKL